MATYLVRWEIDIDADSPEEAAQEALKVQRNPASEAVVFEVGVRNFEMGAQEKFKTIDLLFDSDC